MADSKVCQAVLDYDDERACEVTCGREACLRCDGEWRCDECAQDWLADIEPDGVKHVVEAPYPDQEPKK